MKIIGIIPARKGSKRLKYKNIYSLKGKPLIGYSIKAALDSIGIGFTNYIRYKNDEAGFRKHLESMKNVDKLKEGVEKDTK